MSFSMRNCLAFLLLFCTGMQEPQDLGNFKLLKHTDGHYELIPLDPPVEPFPAFTDEFTSLNLDDWEILANTATADGDLKLTAAAQVRCKRSWDRPLQIRMPLLKNNRRSKIEFCGFFVLVGGRDAEGGTTGVKHKFGDNVSIHSGTTQHALCASQVYITSQEEVLTIKIGADDIRVYLQRLSDGAYLHGDTAWRAQPGPCIVHETTTPAYENWQDIKIQAVNTPTAPVENFHRYHSFSVSEAVDFDGEAYFPPPSNVPPLAADGLSLPVLDSPWDHVGLAWRADGPDYAVDDPCLLPDVSVSPFGAPPNFPGKGLAYMTGTIWENTGEWNSWVAHCAANSIDPNVGKIGPIWGEPGGEQGFAGGSEIGVKNLASSELKAWLKTKAAGYANNPLYAGIFFDVASDHPGVSFDIGYTATQWFDLQGAFYREVWKDALQPADKFPMVNVGNAKTDRNRRIIEWIPIAYFDRQMLPLTEGWNWYEQTVKTNPQYRLQVFGNNWISVIDSPGGDANCLNEDIKYGWLTTNYHRIATLGGWDHRHFLGGGFNGDKKADGTSGRYEWRARHYVPAMTFDVGQPASGVTISATWTPPGSTCLGKLYVAEFEHATVYHYPKAVDTSTIPYTLDSTPYVLNFSTPHDVLQYDGTWLENQNSVSIPAGSGRIVRVSQ